jgi:Domain of unknown function (DUF5671)
VNSPELQKFFESAQTSGLGQDSIATLLQGRGWPKDDAYRAIADYYESRNAVTIPAYKRSGSAKDAFLYLLSFGSLATWSMGLGSVAFTLIERWIRDPLAPNNPYSYGYYQMADALASVIVAFPIYLLVMRYIVREVESHPEKLESSVRKWLTYLALLIAAGVVLGDLITFLTYFLRGEVTTRFVAKVIVVLVISGGIFWYYFGSLQKHAPRESQV